MQPFDPNDLMNQVFSKIGMGNTKMKLGRGMYDGAVLSVVVSAHSLDDRSNLGLSIITEAGSPIEANTVLEPLGFSWAPSEGHEGRNHLVLVSFIPPQNLVRHDNYIRGWAGTNEYGDQHTAAAHDSALL